MGDTGTDGTSREVAAPRVLAGGTGAAEPWQYLAQVGAQLGAAGSPWPPASSSFLPLSLSQLLSMPPPTPLGLSSHPPARPHFSGFELILSTPLAAGCQLSIPQPPPHPPPSSACLPLQETPAAAAGRTDGRTDTVQPQNPAAPTAPGAGARGAPGRGAGARAAVRSEHRHRHRCRDEEQRQTPHGDGHRAILPSPRFLPSCIVPATEPGMGNEWKLLTRARQGGHRGASLAPGPGLPSWLPRGVPAARRQRSPKTTGSGVASAGARGRSLLAAPQHVPSAASAPSQGTKSCPGPGSQPRLWLPQGFESCTGGQNLHLSNWGWC